MENELFNNLPQYKETCTIYCIIDEDGVYRARGNGHKKGYVNSYSHRTKKLSEAKYYKTENQANAFLEKGEKVIPILMIRKK